MPNKCYPNLESHNNYIFMFYLYNDIHPVQGARTTQDRWLHQEKALEITINLILNR